MDKSAPKARREMITIEIKVEGEKREEMVMFTNEGLDNYNYLDMYVGDKEYQISINDLEAIVEAFKKERDNAKAQ